MDISPLLIFIVITIMALETILEDIFNRSYLRGIDFWMLELPIIAFFNYKILNFKICRHHYFSIFINSIFSLAYKITSVILLIANSNSSPNPNIYYEYKEHKQLILIAIIIYFIIIIPRAYAITKIKVFMDLKYISPFKLLIIYGIIGTIICIIIGTISSFFKCNKLVDFDINICNVKDKKNENETYFENFALYWKKQKNATNILNEIFLFIFGIISNFFYAAFYMLIIKKLTPMHIYFLNIIYIYLLKISAYIFRLKDYLKNDKKILQIIFLLDQSNKIIVIFGLLTYLEIIELKCCKLNYDLKKNIINRGIKDYISPNIELLEDDIDDKIENDYN